MPKILVVGCGSIGQRHIRNLLALGERKICIFDVCKNKLEETMRLSPSITMASSQQKIWDSKPDIAIIATPSSLHLRYALQAASCGCHLFIEKPLSHSDRNTLRLIKIARANKIITLVGCNMRFYWAIVKIRELIKKNAIGKILSARIEAGQYLPDWHPWEDYRQMYSARKNLGGGIILDGIHEIDYALWLFGPLHRITGMHARLSRLDIDTEDIAELVYKFKNGPLVNIHLDYLQRAYTRNCKIIGEAGTVKWDFNDHAVFVYLASTKQWRAFKEPAGYQTNQMYIDEMKYFLNCVRKKRPTFNDVESGLKTLRVALDSKKARFKIN